jgi:hypothetical protein
LSLARHYEELVRQHGDADRSGRDVTELGTEMAFIAEAASHLSPKTRAGAAFQIMLASAEVDTINGEASQLKASKLMVQRLLYRSLEAMRDGVAEFPRAKSYLMQEEFDPRMRREG